MEWKESQALLERARRVIAGGVNSNVRLLAQPAPLFFERGEGARIIDVDGNSYVDFVLGQGPLIHGHSHPELLAAAARGMAQGQMFAGQHRGEVELAERVCALVPGAERVRFSSSGSEAVQAALRLARAVTGRPRVLKFEGHYHGWFDNVLISVAPPIDRAGPREAPLAVPGSRGQETSALEGVVVLPWNDADLLEQTLAARCEEIAAVITEPVMCNTGCIEPEPGYLRRMRDACSRHGVVLIFDEVITGFRLAPGGAQERYGIVPDLCTFGKAMAGGFPISCLAGRSELMEELTRGVNHSGTYNASPPIIAASIACLDLLTRDGGAAYRRMEALGVRLREGLARALEEAGEAGEVSGVAGVSHVGLTKGPIRDYRTAAGCDATRYHAVVRALMAGGVRTLERGLWYLSTVHEEADVDLAVRAFGEALRAA